MGAEPLTVEQLMTLPAQDESMAALLAWRILQLNEQVERLVSLVQLQQDVIAQEITSCWITTRMRDALLDQVREQDVDLRHRRVLLPDRVRG